MHSLKFLGENKTLKGTNMHFLYLFFFVGEQRQAPSRLLLTHYGHRE